MGGRGGITIRRCCFRASDLQGNASRLSARKGSSATFRFPLQIFNHLHITTSGSVKQLRRQARPLAVSIVMRCGSSFQRDTSLCRLMKFCQNQHVK